MIKIKLMVGVWNTDIRTCCWIIIQNVFYEKCLKCVTYPFQIYQSRIFQNYNKIKIWEMCKLYFNLNSLKMLIVVWKQTLKHLFNKFKPKEKSLRMNISYSKYLLKFLWWFSIVKACSFKKKNTYIYSSE